MSAPVNVHFDDGSDWGVKAQNAAEEHLNECLAAFYADEDDRGYEENFPEYPEEMGGPFCGCETCMVREVLFAAWPILLEAARAEIQN